MHLFALKNHKYTQTGEAGSGKSEIAINFAKDLTTSPNIAEISMCKGFAEGEVFTKHLT